MANLPPCLLLDLRREHRSVFLYNWLDGIVEGCAARMQDSVAQLFTLEAERRSADVVAFGAPQAVKAHAASA